MFKLKIILSLVNFLVVAIECHTENDMFLFCIDRFLGLTNGISLKKHVFDINHLR